MLTTIYNIALIFIIIIICCLATLTDLKYGKVFNKHILIFLLIGAVINLIYFCYAVYSEDLNILTLLRYFVNFFIGSGISYLLYNYDIWAAGDAKLYILILILTPYNLIIDNTLNYFPGFTILVFIFSISFLFVAIETLVLLGRDLKNSSISYIKHRELKANKPEIIDFILKYAVSFFFTSIVNEIMLFKFSSFYFSNRGLVLLLNVFVIIMLLNIFNGKKIIIVCVMLCIFYIGLKMFMIPFTSKSIYVNLYSFTTVICIVFIRYLGAKYNYKEIQTNDVKEGMILSLDTVFLFKKSKVRGLPNATTETTDSRINVENAESIIRWGNSKFGSPTIKIVKHIPFAPFISLGTLVFIIIRVLQTHT